jgi:hypothetical protein
MEFAHWDSIEHSIETGSLEHIDFRDIHYFGNLPHGTETEEIIVLFLGQHQQRNATRSFIVGGEICQYLLDFDLIFRSKFENF